MEQIRKLEFSRIANSGEVYVDHAGAALYSERHVLETTSDLLTGIYGNPHSTGLASKRSLDTIKNVRKRVLQHFGVDSTTHSVIFTSGATQALKLVGECFPFTKDSIFRYANTSHNSLVGIREYAALKGAKCQSINVNINGETKNFFQSIINKSTNVKNTEFINKELDKKFKCTLTALPAECNWSGTKYDLSPLKNHTGEKKEDYILIDGSKFVGLDIINLLEYPLIDYFVLSFYKIFGYPTGLGCLIAKKESLQLLSQTRIYFGGGTILDAGITDGPGSHKRKSFNSHEAFEDGTIDFLGILALRRGFELLDRIKFNLTVEEGEKNTTNKNNNNKCTKNPTNGHHCVIRDYAFKLSQKLYFSLKQLIHQDSQKPVCILYSVNHELRDPKKQGPVVTFNVQFPNGDFVGHGMVKASLTRANIQARSGCFCSPGGCASFMKLSNIDVKKQYEKGHVCGGSIGVIDGKPTGAVRVSLSWSNTEAEVEKIVNVIKRSFMGRSKIDINNLTESSIETNVKKEQEEDHVSSENSMMKHLLENATNAVNAIALVSRPNFSVGTLVGTIFDDSVAKISKIEDDADGKKSYTLLFEDGFEMIGLMEKEIIVACVKKCD